DRLQQQIPVTKHAQPVLYLDPQVDILVFGDRLVDIADLAQHFVQRDGAESRRPPAVFDFREAQQRRDDRKRLVDARDRLVGGGLELLQGGRVGSPAFQREPCPRQRRSQVV